MIFWLYLADRVNVITNCIAGFFGVLIACIIIALFIGGMIFIFPDEDSNEYFNQYKNFIINIIKKYKLSYICSVLAIIYILLPSRSLIYTKLAFDTGSIVLEKVTPLQEKALKSIELYLDDYIESKKKKKQINRKFY